MRLIGRVVTRNRILRGPEVMAKWESVKNLSVRFFLSHRTKHENRSVFVGSVKTANSTLQNFMLIRQRHLVYQAVILIPIVYCPILSGLSFLPTVVIPAKSANSDRQGNAVW